MVPVLVIILNLRKVLLLLMINGKNEAAAIFGDLVIQVVTGHRFLGGFIGSHSERDEYVVSKVQRWVGHLDLLSEAALTQPQLAYAALSRFYSTNGLFCCVLFRSVASYFRNLKCHFSLIFCQLCLVLKCLQLNDVCLRFLCD